MFVGLNQDVKHLSAAATLVGKLEHVGDPQVPIVITLSRAGTDGITLESYTVVYGNGDFTFMVPAGDFYLVAFEDKNQDFTLQPEERVGWFGEPDLIRVGAGENRADLPVVLRDAATAKQQLPQLYMSSETNEPVNLERVNLGAVVDVNQFQPELGPKGMWQPVAFVNDGHAGLFFLEPYDRAKTPILFVHGISGSGHDWRYLVDQLDRTRFQPWIVQYPSGLRLATLARAISQSLNELQASYGFDDLVVVAHSMGGLVARGMINEQLHSGRDVIRTFITISTPWLGHDAASKGVKHAPVAVPAWFDMVPGSPYLSELDRQPLPNDIQHFLLFSHNGKASGLLSGSNSDGTVTLRSQLPLPVQERAELVLGFDEDHRSVLQSSAVAKKINSIVKNVIP